MRLRSILLLAAVAAAAACSTDRQDVAAPTDADIDPSLRRGGWDPTPSTLELRKIGGYAGEGGEGAAEITAYDPASERLFVVNGAQGTVDVLDLHDPSAPVKVATLDISAFGPSANSVATGRGLVAVAIQANDKTAPGTVAFYRAETLELVSTATVGALPDMVTFTNDGKKVLVANEGEPNDDYTVDPEGSVSIIDVRDVRRPRVRTADFRRFNRHAEWLRARGVRIFGPNATVAQDLEPEYITVDDEGERAWVSLQENNALAEIDIEGGYVRRILPLGYKRHDLAGNALDASDRDGGINIANWPVLGMYQPDAIAAFSVRGRTFLVTANEGDARDYGGFAEEVRVGASSVVLDPALDAACGGSCKNNTRLGRLTITNTLGRNPETGVYERLYAFGARSFSVWSVDGRQLYDSGDEFERRTTNLPNVAFNASNTGNTLDDRSDNKGPEPEGVVVGTFGRKTFAFIGLERVGGVMVYDVTSPTRPEYVTYLNTREGAGGDLGPEGLAFVSAKDSPNGKPLLIVGHEISGTTAIYEIVLR
jgi:hypothetical protein